MSVALAVLAEAQKEFEAELALNPGDAAAEYEVGTILQARQKGADAVPHFERAAALYPRAQSPLLALSQLSRRAGDRPAAQRELRILAELPEDERQREDPWWNYYDVR